MSRWKTINSTFPGTPKSDQDYLIWANIYCLNIPTKKRQEAKELCNENIFLVSSWESTANQFGQLLTQLSSNHKKARKVSYYWAG